MISEGLTVGYTKPSISISGVYGGRPIETKPVRDQYAPISCFVCLHITVDEKTAVSTIKNTLGLLLRNHCKWLRIWICQDLLFRHCTSL